MKKYILENKSEFERLEKQSNTDLYDHKRDLKGVPIPEKGHFLDLGCGSGIITRYLAETYPNAFVTGVDASAQRVEQSQEKVRTDHPHLKNIEFAQGDATQLNYENDTFDFIVCRYIFHHLTPQQIEKATQSVFRCLKPNGVFCIVDIDGAFLNIYPRTEVMDQVLKGIEKGVAPDYCVGRKLPSILKQAGFSNVDWRMHCVDFQGEARQVELELNRERFLGFQEFLSNILGGDRYKVKQFISEYLSVMSDPSTVAFYNKLIITSKKQSTSKLKLVSNLEQEHKESKPEESSYFTAADLSHYQKFKKNLQLVPSDIQSDWDSSWGHYFEGHVLAGNQFKTTTLSRGELRVALFVSYSYGRRVLESIISRVQSRKDINLVGVVTDDVIDPNAKISKKKRLWKDMSQEKQELYQNSVEYVALSHQVPVYTGQVKALKISGKNIFLDKILPEWRPDIIITTGFGQKISKELIQKIPCGVYNLHPSVEEKDANGNLRLKYVGVAPLVDMIQDKQPSAKVAVHHVTDEIDLGHIVGLSHSASLYESNSGELKKYLDTEGFLNRMGFAAQQAVNCLLDEVLKSKSIVYSFDIINKKS